MMVYHVELSIVNGKLSMVNFLNSTTLLSEGKGRVPILLT